MRGVVKGVEAEASRPRAIEIARSDTTSLRDVGKRRRGVDGQDQARPGRDGYSSEGFQSLATSGYAAATIRRRRPTTAAARSATVNPRKTNGTPCAGPSAVAPR